MTDVRGASLDCLVRIMDEGQYSHVVLKEALEKLQFRDRRDRAFFTRLTEGVVERALELDYMIDQFSRVRTEKMKPVIREILRMAVYQIKYMDSVPDSAAINEAVKLAAKRKFGNLRGFVNGVLRALLRGMDGIRLPDPETDFPAYAGAVYSMPSWITETLCAAYGRERTERILEGGVNERPFSVRINLSRAPEEEILSSLAGQGIAWEKTEGIPGAYILKGYDSPAGIEAFAGGFLQVQDVSSMLAGLAAAPEKGSLVLDVCAAPGGKSLHAADLMAGTGHVEARDLTEAKVRLIKENTERCGFRNVSARVWDALRPDPEMFGKADVVIADLPCSGLGIIGRKSDIKYKLTEEGASELAVLQRRILDVVWQYVKPGGRLVYSTCTILPGENAGNADWFEAHYPFRPESLDPVLPERFRTEETKKGRLQLFPGEKGTDGFFIARFVREAGA